MATRRLHFDVRQPATPEDAYTFINSYPSPEEAEQDIPSQARDWLTQGGRYDPFAEAKKARDEAVYQASRNGASIAVGSNMGSRILAPPQQPQTISQAETGGRRDVAPMVSRSMIPPAAPLGISENERAMGVSPNAKTSSGSGSVDPRLLDMMASIAESRQTRGPGHYVTHELENELYNRVTEARSNDFQVAGKNLQLPADPLSTNFDAQGNPINYTKVLAERANRKGVGDLYRKIFQNNPQVFAEGPGHDQTYSRLQGGKIEASNAMHKIAADPDFQEALRRTPREAYAMYQVATNGRDYEIDRQAQTKQFAEQDDASTNLIKNAKGLHRDAAGNWMEMREVKDTAGNITQKAVPVSDVLLAVLQKKGIGNVYGIDMPAKMNLSPKGQQEFLARTRQLTDQGMPQEEAERRAQAQMHEEQQRERNAGTLESGTRAEQDAMLQMMPPAQRIATLQQPRQRPGFIKAADSLGRFMGSGVNAFTQGVLNPALTVDDESILRSMFPSMDKYAMTIPRAKLPSDAELDAQYNDPNNPTFTEVLEGIMGNIAARQH